MTVPYGSTEDGLELQTGVNHFGHYYLTLNLINLLNSTLDSRIVNIASIAHKYGNLKKDTFLHEDGKKYSKMRAYAQSKLANLLFTYKLQEKLEKQNSNILVLAAHPGVSKTNLGSHIKSGSVKWVQRTLSLSIQSQVQGALPGIRACTDKSVTSGQYYGPSSFFEFRGHPIIVKSTKRSHSKELQNILWTESVRHTRLDLHL
jgi:NAD(P)-dependent dehydrogenase (short-subunit alcohol dehydrogenase family)